jgi:hypothetical protein
MNAIIDGGVGRASIAIRGMMTTAPMTTVCTTTERGTVYYWLLPTLMDGSTTSPNILSARGTGNSSSDVSSGPNERPIIARP